MFELHPSHSTLSSIGHSSSQSLDLGLLSTSSNTNFVIVICVASILSQYHVYQYEPYQDYLLHGYFPVSCALAYPIGVT